jgi:probable phosphoglycerate mutase
LDELKEKYPNKNILVVCHNGVCRVLRSYFDDVTNEEFFAFTQENASYKEYDL